MNRPLTFALLALSTVPLAACAGTGVEVAYAPGPYAYDGWYDGYYGPIYDGYWGNDGYFYYRHGEGEGAFVRGDRAHFARQAPQGPHNFQRIQGNTAPRQGVRAPHFPGGGGHGGGEHGGGERH
ncbi:hypothetical protein [Novosphingobium sp. FSW06-99]|uniref:hypothetical protein n=1 Tax=Novosphingobium sp. FSW06-99 TaxID=1739113 RepID=UPI00076D9203|nr:hypothetical protein [Novosphingobium sp. FSW06-99]KUR76103.1 hypothetical protein AQZ49_13870 [Novosphingobium sp. FSW06-99]